MTYEAEASGRWLARASGASVTVAVAALAPSQAGGSGARRAPVGAQSGDRCRAPYQYQYQYPRRSLHLLCCLRQSCAKASKQRPVELRWLAVEGRAAQSANQSNWTALPPPLSSPMPLVTARQNEEFVILINLKQKKQKCQRSDAKILYSYLVS